MLKIKDSGKIFKAAKEKGHITDREQWLKWWLTSYYKLWKPEVDETSCKCWVGGKMSIHTSITSKTIF